MTFLVQSPANQVLVDGQTVSLARSPEVPEDAFPPVIEGNHPLMIVDDFALDLYGSESPAGYTGLWVIRDGHLFLRWLLGSTRVKWDLKADWFTGDLDCQKSKIHCLIHVDHGNVQAFAA
jgi:hypothetical protein